MGARGVRAPTLHLGAVCATALATLALGATPAAAQSPNPLLGAARLQGTFQMAGQLTVAANVRGERLGQAVSRTWSLSSNCPAGPCSTVTLFRQRAAGTDTLTLQQTSPGYYAGSGGFYAPLQCGTATYPAGEWVPFTIAVQVTNAAAQDDGTVTATNVSATYTNPYRVNLTPCVAVLGRDAAAYQGTLVGPARDLMAARRRAAKRRAAKARAKSTARAAQGRPAKPRQR
jgi:hypothetical protein